jgi:hypothetical protein
MIPEELIEPFKTDAFVYTCSAASGWGPFVAFVRSRPAFAGLLEWLRARPADGADAVREWLSKTAERSAQPLLREVVESVGLVALIDSPTVDVPRAWLSELGALGGPWAEKSAKLLSDVLYGRVARVPERVRLLGELRVTRRGSLGDGRKAIVARTAAKHHYLLLAIGGDADRDQWLVLGVPGNDIDLAGIHASAVLPVLEDAEPLLYVAVTRESATAVADAHEIDWARLPVEVLPRGAVRWEESRWQVMDQPIDLAQLSSVVLLHDIGKHAPDWIEAIRSARPRNRAPSMVAVSEPSIAFTPKMSNQPPRRGAA